MAVAKKRASTGAVVLPKAGNKAGRKTIRSVDQLLTTKQRQNLRRDLAQMARQRRDAEASSGTLRLS